MFHVRTMTEQDLPFAARITSKQGWNLTEADFRFAIELEPQGCFVLLDAAERVGLATNIAYGNTAWFGNLIVSPEHRRKGAGSQLVNHSINYLTRKKVKTIGLYAYAERIPFYTHLGFTHESNFAALTGKGFASQLNPTIRPARSTETNMILKCDKACFGGPRKKLLEPIMLDHDNLTYIAHEKNRIVGYAVAKVYRGVAELGPLICPKGRDDVAVSLLEALLNRLEGVETTIVAPEKETAILNMLKKKGFKEHFNVARMFSGPPTTDQCILLAESLERG